MACCVVVPDRASRVDKQLRWGECALLEYSADMASIEASQLTVWACTAACPSLTGGVVHRRAAGSVSSQGAEISVAAHCIAGNWRALRALCHPVHRFVPPSIVAETDETAAIQTATHAIFVPGFRCVHCARRPRRAMRAHYARCAHRAALAGGRGGQRADNGNLQTVPLPPPIACEYLLSLNKAIK